MSNKQVFLDLQDLRAPLVQLVGLALLVRLALMDRLEALVQLETPVH